MYNPNVSVCPQTIFNVKSVGENTCNNPNFIYIYIYIYIYIKVVLSSFRYKLRYRNPITTVYTQMTQYSH